MKRLFLFGFSFLFCLLSCAYPRPSFAQQKIMVRSGGHEAFSRVVFDWGRNVGYEIDESRENLLVIRFKEPGSVDLSGFDPSKLKNVTGFRVLQNDPLIVSMIVPEASEVKAFSLLGNRFVVDVYNPGHKAEPEKKEEPTETAKAEPAPLPPKKPEQEKPEKKEPPQKIAQTAGQEQGSHPDMQGKAEEKNETVNPESEEKPEEKQKIAGELPHSLPPGEYESNGLKYELIPETSALAKPPPIDNQPAEPEKPEHKEPEQPETVAKTAAHTAEQEMPSVPENKGEDRHEQKHGQKAETAQAPVAHDKHSEPSPEPSEQHEPQPEPKDNESITPVPKLKVKEEAKPEIVPPSPQIKADPSALHVLTVTSTSAVGLSVFEQGGELWFVTDQESRHLEPVVNSKTPHIFAPFVNAPLTGGQVFRTSYPSGYNVRSKGEELSWKIIFDKQQTTEKPVEPERVTRSGNFSRGGKIVWPVKDATAVLETVDPLSGRTLKIVTVRDSAQFVGQQYDFVDFTILHSIVGMAIRPKVDNLEVRITEEGVEITRPGGLAVLPEKLVEDAALEEQFRKSPHKSSKPEGPKIFNFSQWQRIPFESLDKNTNLVLAELPLYSKSSRAEDLIALAKAYLLSGMGAEALGFLEFAVQELPDMAKNPEYVALRGMANAFDGKTDVALAYLQRPELEKYEEVGYWKAYVLADLGDWQQAIDVMPLEFGPFYEYPGQVSRRLALVLSEVLLRAGEVDKADELLALIEHYKADLNAPMEAALDYLRGESARQKGQRQKAIDTWKKLEEGQDDLYRVKAGLAVTRLLDESGAIPTEKVIDRLERLRYAWRGDEIEGLVNYWLGDAYFRKKEYVKGLTIMRDASEVSGNTELARRVAADMRKAFTDLYMGPDLEKLSALDAVALFEQFRELNPPGAEGDKIERMLAEHLVKADLLGRASEILENQVNKRLKGEDLIRVGKRLAVVYLLDRQPQKALRTLSKLENPVKLALPGQERDRTEYEMTLLRARANAQDNRAQQALNILKGMEPTSDVNRLRADISWQAGFWAEAADALNQVLEGQSLGAEPLSEQQTQIIMNLAVALNLANDRIAIASLRKKYGSLMVKTPKAHQFEVITRERRNAVLADRETLMSVVSEVDLFKEFLNAYKSDDIIAPQAPETETKRK